MTDHFSTRRALLAGGLGLASLALAGCQTTKTADGEKPGDDDKPRRGFGFGGGEPLPDGNWALMYASQPDGQFTLPPIPWEKVPERFRRQVVDNTTGEKPGTLVVETSGHFLYWTMPRGKAIRYGVGLGKQGFEWSGEGVVRRKAEWPRWHPPEEMIERKPELKKYSTTYDRKTDTWGGGMDGGLLNPLGARALYIYQGNVDTLYRLHGSPEWNSIGKSVSSGCVRLMNQDVIDLHSRVPSGTRIIVR